MEITCACTACWSCQALQCGPFTQMFSAHFLRCYIIQRRCWCPGRESWRRVSIVWDRVAYHFCRIVTVLSNAYEHIKFVYNSSQLKYAMWELHRVYKTPTLNFDHNFGEHWHFQFFFHWQTPKETFYGSVTEISTSA